LNRRAPILDGIYAFHGTESVSKLARLVEEKADFSFVDEISESEDERSIDESNALNLSRDSSISNSPNIDVIKGTREKVELMDKRFKRKRCELQFMFKR
jgi:hypothetical protein